MNTTTTTKCRVINIILIILVVIIAGCNSPMGKTNKSGEPFDEAVEVNSFRGNGTIAVKWRVDQSADEYVLMRAQDEVDRIGEYEAIYRGHDTNYIDKSVGVDIRYVYRLDKLSGTNEYMGQETGIGVGSRAEVDMNEPNDKTEDATPLGFFKRGTMFYYRFSDGRELADVDWYKVTIGGAQTEYIQIREDGTVGMTMIMIKLPGKEAVVAEQGKWYEIKNETGTEKDLYIELRPDTGSYVGPGMTGGTVRGYTIVRSDHMEDMPGDGTGGGSTDPGNGNGGNGNGIGGPGTPIGNIEEQSELFVNNGSGWTLFLLNDTQYKGTSYTFWKHLGNIGDTTRGIEMNLIKESGSYLGGYGYFFEGGDVSGYGECMLVVLLQKDGNYAIGKVIAGSYQSVKGWKSSVYLRQGYGVQNTIGVKKNSDTNEYVVTINGAEETRFIDAEDPVCNGNGVGVVAVVTSGEEFPKTPVKTWYAGK
jgi:hypothetical protein